MKQGIKYLHRSEIDTIKWNECIANAHNGSCYADAEYLDIMTTSWDALVMNDYEVVMPLPFRKKYGIKYLYQPNLCQQLGIIGANDELTDYFLSSVPGSFKYWDIKLNFSNRTDNYKNYLRKNYLLDLSGDYDTIAGNYSRSAVRNIKLAGENNITILEDVLPEVVINLHRARFGENAGLGGGDAVFFNKLLTKWLTIKRVYIVAAIDASSKIIASSAYIIYKNRVTFILNGNLKESLDNGATHFLKDHVIRKFAGKGMILDFEGSENSNFARFYEQFGAKEIEYYPHIINNKLPWPLKLFK